MDRDIIVKKQQKNTKPVSIPPVFKNPEIQHPNADNLVNKMTEALITSPHSGNRNTNTKNIQMNTMTNPLGTRSKPGTRHLKADS